MSEIKATENFYDYGRYANTMDLFMDFNSPSSPDTQ